jgi:hypothetical protein
MMHGHAKWTAEWSAYRGPVMVVERDYRVLSANMVDALPKEPACVVIYGDAGVKKRVHPRWVWPVPDWSVKQR